MTQDERQARMDALLREVEGWPKVAAPCPACYRADTLRLADDGAIVCANNRCPDPAAADVALNRPRPQAFSLTYEAHPRGHGQGVGYLFDAMADDVAAGAQAHVRHMTPGDRAILAELCRLILTATEARREPMAMCIPTLAQDPDDCSQHDHVPAPFGVGQ